MIATQLAVGLAALLLFAWSMSLVMIEPAGGGESRIANAYAGLFATLFLWGALLVLLFLDLARAGFFSRSGILGLFLLPLAAAAQLLATDSPHDPFCRAAIPLLPLLFGAYALLPPPRSKAWSSRARASLLITILLASAWVMSR